VRQGLRVIIDTAGRPPWWQMALDEALLEAAGRGVSPPTLRVYTFSPTSVSIGYFQSLRGSVRLEEAERLAVPVVRRFTGGGSVLHSEDGEVTYSIALPAEGRLRDIVESYRILCTALASALRMLGVEAAYAPPNDVVVAGRKVSGNAQARRGRALLQHGTILLRPDRELMEKLLVAPRAKLESHGVSGIGERVVGVEEVLERRLGLEELAEVLEKAFAETLQLEPYRGWYTLKELEHARTLKNKYRSRQWLEKRP